MKDRTELNKNNFDKTKAVRFHYSEKKSEKITQDSISSLVEDGLSPEIKVQTDKHLADLNRLTSQYSQIKYLTKGAFGYIYLAEKKVSTDKTEAVVIKVLPSFAAIKPEYRALEFETLRRELFIMINNKHQNLVALNRVFDLNEKLQQAEDKNNPQYCIEMPYLEKGSCEQFLNRHASSGVIKEELINLILFQVLQGLNYLHKNTSIHRDIKPGNILFSKTGCVKLTDFGTSKTLGINDLFRNSEKAHTFTGTCFYMAPEVCKQDKIGYSFPADIWSLGITALTLCFGYAPGSRNTYPMKHIISLIDDNVSPPDFKSYTHPPACEKPSTSLKSFVNVCLNKNPEKRPSAEKLLNKHKLFSKIRKYSRVEVESLTLQYLDEIISLKKVHEAKSLSNRP